MHVSVPHTCNVCGGQRWVLEWQAVSSRVDPGTHTQVVWKGSRALARGAICIHFPRKRQTQGKNAEMAGVLIWCKFCLLQTGTWASPGPPSHGLEREASSNSRVLEQSGASCQFGREGLSTPS